MKLSTDQIRSLTVGAVHMEEQEGILSFFKCTKQQSDAWFALNKGLGERSLTTTGIRLDFHTDSKHLTFTPASPGKYEVDVDGLLRCQFHAGSEEFPVGQPISLPLCGPLGEIKEEVRVTLYLPSHSVGSLSAVELDEGAKTCRHSFDRKWLMIGDSITQGWDSQFDSLSYAYRVSRFFNAESVIQGIGGARFHESTFDAALPFDPDVVSVAYGTNDFNHYKTKEEMRAHTRSFLEQVAKTYEGKSIFVISPIWRADSKERPLGTFEEARAVVIQEAERLGLIHIDGLELVPPLPEFFADKYLHPHDMGFGVYAEQLISRLQAYLS